MIALDLDGTLLDQLEGPSPEVLAALEHCQAEDIQLAFLTGRRPKTTRMGLRGFGGPAYIATNSGCISWRYPAWERLDRRTLGAELVLPLVELLSPYTINLYCDADIEDSGIVHLRRECTAEMALSRERFGYGAVARQDLCGLDLAQVTQMAMPGPRALILDLQREIRGRFEGRVLALCVGWPLVPCHALEVFQAEAHKGSALARFALREGIDREDVVAIGDDTNDINMLQWAGIGVAMPHANEETQAAADFVLGSDGRGHTLLLADYLHQLAQLER